MQAYIFCVYLHQIDYVLNKLGTKTLSGDHPGDPLSFEFISSCITTPYT